jgi:hypothetical protein
VATFPPLGQKNYTATLNTRIQKSSGETTMVRVLKVTMDDSTNLQLHKVELKSANMGAKPPAGAVVLFDGGSVDAWDGGRIETMDKEIKVINPDGKDIRTKQKFNDYTLHAEFLLPYAPEKRGQARGNSGIYQVDMYEVQILDSFGLAGKDDECGGVFKKIAPRLNMCYPPLTWQTLDIEFTNAVKQGAKLTKAKITVRLNGVIVIDRAEIPGPTQGARKDPEGTPGPIQLQGHLSPILFRNIWVAEKK